MDIKQQIEEIVKNDFFKGKPTFILMANWYCPNSAGTMAMYMLSKYIRNAGFNSFMVLWDGYPQQNKDYIAYKTFDKVSIFIPIEFARELCQKYNCIAIYTDHDPGNLLNSKIVARWLGNKPGNLTPYIFDGYSEKIFTYYKCFGNMVENLAGVLTIFPMYDELIKLYYYNSNVEKKFITSYAGRNQFIEGITPTIDIRLNRVYPNNKQDLSRILQQTKVLYIFDQITALTYEALMCGCKVVIIDQNNVFSRDDYMTIEHGSVGTYLLGDNLNDSLAPDEISNSVCEKIKKINQNFNNQFINFMNIMISEYVKSIKV